MFVTGTCPKCGSSYLITVPGKAGPYWDGNNIPVGLRRENAVLVTRYVCRQCGYSEEWIHPDDLERLADSIKED